MKTSRSLWFLRAAVLLVCGLAMWLGDPVEADATDRVASAPAPGPVSHLAATQCADQPDSIFLFGGAESVFPFAYRDAFWRYDAGTNTWTELPPYPEALMVLSATCYDGVIYVAGGIQISTYVSDSLYASDTVQGDTDAWEYAGPLPRAVWGAALG